jgi:HSP20 family protein
MPMDLYRSGDHYVLRADLPGVDPDSVDVSVDGGILTVTAQRSERTEHDVQWLSSERFTGSYLRRLSLGQDIDADHIAATYQNGVLTVTLPRRPGPSAHRGSAPRTAPAPPARRSR